MCGTCRVRVTLDAGLPTGLNLSEVVRTFGSCATGFKSAGSDVDMACAVYPESWLGVFEEKKKTDGVSESLKTVVEDQRGVFQQQTSQGDFFWAPCLDGT